MDGSCDKRIIFNVYVYIAYSSCTFNSFISSFLFQINYLKCVLYNWDDFKWKLYTRDQLMICIVGRYPAFYDNLYHCFFFSLISDKINAFDKRTPSLCLKSPLNVPSTEPRSVSFYHRFWQCTKTVYCTQSNPRCVILIFFCKLILVLNIFFFFWFPCFLTVGISISPETTISVDPYWIL